MADSIFSGLAGWFGGNKTKNSNTNPNGTGTYAFMQGTDGSYVGMDKDAYDTYSAAAKTSGIENSAVKVNGVDSGGSSWFGKDGYLGMGAQVIGAGSSLMNTLTGMKALKLAEDQFAHEKGLAAANLYNSGTLANNALQNRTEVGTTLAGNAMTDMEKQAAMDKTKAGFVKTAIG